MEGTPRINNASRRSSGRSRVRIGQERLACGFSTKFKAISVFFNSRPIDRFRCNSIKMLILVVLVGTQAGISTAFSTANHGQIVTNP
jgi:hypothetical protein